MQEFLYNSKPHLLNIIYTSEMLFLSSILSGERKKGARSTCGSGGLSPPQIHWQGRHVSFPFAEMPWEVCPGELPVASVGNPNNQCSSSQEWHKTAEQPAKKGTIAWICCSCVFDLYLKAWDSRSLEIFSLPNKMDRCSLYLQKFLGVFKNPIKHSVCMLWQIF